MSKIKNYNSDCGLASGVDAKLQSTNRFISQKQQYVLLETHYFYCRTKTKIHKKKKKRILLSSSSSVYRWWFPKWRSRGDDWNWKFSAALATKWNENAHKPITLPVIRHKAEKTVFFFREVEENREERIKLKGHCGYSIHPVFMIVSTGWRRLVSSSIMLWSCDRSIDWFLLAIRKYDLRSLEWSKSIQNINFMREHAAFNVLNQVHSMKCAFFNFHYLLLYLCLEFRLRWPSENILKYCIKRLWTSCSCMYRNICEDLLLVFCFRCKFVAVHQQHLTHIYCKLHRISFHSIFHSGWTRARTRGKAK